MPGASLRGPASSALLSLCPDHITGTMSGGRNLRCATPRAWASFDVDVQSVENNSWMRQGSLRERYHIHQLGGGRVHSLPGTRPRGLLPDGDRATPSVRCAAKLPRLPLRLTPSRLRRAAGRRTRRNRGATSAWSRRRLRLRMSGHAQAAGGNYYAITHIGHQVGRHHHENCQEDSDAPAAATRSWCFGR